MNIAVKSPFAKVMKNGNMTDLACCALLMISAGEVSEDVVNRKEEMKCVAYDPDQTLYKINYKKGAIFKVSLGIAAQIPMGMEVKIYPRSSLRKHHNCILTNSVGVIDDTYSGNEDVWQAELYAIDDGHMYLGDRIVQFELVNQGYQPAINYVDRLKGNNRGGFGSTGR